MRTRVNIINLNSRHCVRTREMIRYMLLNFRDDNVSPLPFQTFECPPTHLDSYVVMNDALIDELNLRDCEFVAGQLLHQDSFVAVLIELKFVVLAAVLADEAAAVIYDDAVVHFH